ncbi:1,4-alpha-glucan branching protein GlgB [Synechococcus sp. Cruz-9H2]|uniref:1,4-alpha-glucan branching protein GlgB n=1 Tax=unclassified Synechococcus TaxID=2626047 RepID=UPI0020CE9B62|nr:MULTISPECIES: 1,4-alpha-glucan branching protein GlgB [unclassified Synechococcus]MCP9818123.1 1,4-alpha-glucan branching protein GlgB [Synechococcus sp. Cruz-9H2]MCP9842377.1 1,4-alpha-glucan branching protein GlgB [Synechococcus sp. Edmonson 11F2]MCP9854519.1 1,4-alpha-glucan branching protein GlgB [Synechococcus sp. Cruz-9C9]MCP9861785.1 1,4-alpha-glucan branching protein GlgB [Synechococcus sp. Cruz-7E5]MCP9869031.1 1,4-alpha-glucan branching protein GlgB [Synechococcus sp. Cruz-7B9]
MPSTSLEWMVQDGQRLQDCRHDHPFAVLGPHPHGDGWVVRAWMPEASQVDLVLDGRALPMATPNHPWIFEVELGEDPGRRYEYRVQRGGIEHQQHDPWAFREEWMGELDRHLFAEGNHHHIWRRLGAHPCEREGIAGVQFALWAPNARSVALLGGFNSWDGRHHPMQLRIGGIWELFVPGLSTGTIYKYEVRSPEGHCYQKADPYGFQHEIRPQTGSVVAQLGQYRWGDQAWLAERDSRDPLDQPISVYELHLGSWMHGPTDQPYIEADGSPRPPVAAADLKPGARLLTYPELADRLIPYVKERGFTHLELMPIAEHPFDGSWGYQVTGFYAPTSRFGPPDEFRAFVDRCHAEGLGVILDWVPGHFPKDSHGLAFFDGCHLYEHADPRIGEHKEWGTLIFNYSRNEVRNFLVANLVFWFEEFHIDGIRVDAVASMLYRDYLRPEGEWLANEHGGRENLEAVRFLQQANSVLFHHFPGALSIAEESTTWPMVTKPTDMGGLGFNLKWNMGWMHDMLDYFELDPWFRQFHQNNVSFSIMYHYTENFMLALSHDEVVHGKSHLLHKMPGDDWQKFANVRALLAYMWTHPGKKTIFMGMEFGQRSEWNVWGDLQWDLLEFEAHQGLRNLVDDLNRFYREEPALWRDDFDHYGFQWIDCSDSRHSVISFMRRESRTGSCVVVVANFTPQSHSHYRIGVPMEGYYAEVFNTDSSRYGGSNLGNLGGKFSEEWAVHGYDQSLDLCLPPLGVLVLKLDPVRSQALCDEAAETGGALG